MQTARPVFQTTGAAFDWWRTTSTRRVRVAFLGDTGRHDRIRCCVHMVFLSVLASTVNDSRIAVN